MRYRHVILEGKPTTGKTEVSNLFKIYFPEQVVILPELTTVLVRQHRLAILDDRKELTDLLVEAVPARAAEVRHLIDSTDRLVLEESHMGVHWAYSRVLDDRYFLQVYDELIAPGEIEPDIYLRLDIPVELSVQRQVARATKDVEVSGDLISRTFANLDSWHRARGHSPVVVDTNRSPEVVIGELIERLGLDYQVFRAG